MDRLERPGHGIEAGGEDQGVEGVIRMADAQAPGCDFINGVRADVDQGDVVAVVGFVVIGVAAAALGRHRMPLGAQQLGHRRAVDPMANFVMNELGSDAVGLGILHQIAE